MDASWLSPGHPMELLSRFERHPAEAGLFVRCLLSSDF